MPESSKPKKPAVRKKKQADAFEINDVVYALAKQVLGEANSGPSENVAVIDFVRAVEADAAEEAESDD